MAEAKQHPHWGPTNTGRHCTKFMQPVWSRELREHLIIPKLVKNFFTFYATREIITVFTTARQLSLS
jgi:hypothetical protein